MFGKEERTATGDDMRTALAKLGTDDVRAMSTAGLADWLVDRHTERDMLDALILHATRELDVRAPLDDLGYQNAQTLVMHRCRISGGHAAEIVRVGRALENMPDTRVAFETGAVSYAQARVFADAATAHADEFARDEAVLVEHGTHLSIRALRTFMNRWTAIIDATSVTTTTDALHDRRGVHISETYEGAYRVDGWLDPESGAVVSTAIRALAEHFLPEDTRTAAQKRADALVAVCRDYLNHGDTPTQGGERPHVAIVADLPFLEGEAGTAYFQDSTHYLARQAVQRLFCDSSVRRVITRGRTELLDIGRLTRVVPAGLRRAVVLRDEHCTFPGCDRPARWCDAHHIKWWRHGGRTDYWNLALLCSYHHHLIHQGAWQLERGPDTQLHFIRPDGTTLTANRAPPWP